MSLIVAEAKRHDVLSRLGGAMDIECQGSKHHSPTPLRVGPVWLSQVVPEVAGEGTPDHQPSEAVYWLCSTCEDNLRVFAMLMLATDGGLDWPVRREFGNIIRALGQDAWAHYKGEPRG